MDIFKVVSGCLITNIREKDAGDCRILLPTSGLVRQETPSAVIQTLREVMAGLLSSVAFRTRLILAPRFYDDMIYAVAEEDTAEVGDLVELSLLTAVLGKNSIKLIGAFRCI